MANWTLGAPPFSYAPNMAAIGNKIYLIRPTENDPHSVQIYNIDTDTWSLGAVFPAETRQYPEYSVCAVGSSIYIVGGKKEGSAIPYSHVWAYNTVTNAWVYDGSIDTPAYGIATAAVGDSIYCIGGARGHETVTYFDTMGIYNTVSHTYVPLSVKAPVAKRGGHCVAHEGKVYWFGGRAPSSQAASEYRLDVFDTATNSWTALAPMTASVLKYSRPASVFENEIYAVATSSNILKYSILQNQWFFGNQVPPPVSESSAIVVGSRLYVMRGYSPAPIAYLDLQSAVISSPSPTAGFINEQAENTFAWELVTSPAGTAQQSAVFQWRAKGSSTINTVNVGSDQHVTIPAGTFPNGAIEWRVMATTASGITSDWTAWYELTTIDVVHQQPTGLYPASGMRDSTKQIQFSWITHSPLSTPQYAFEVQITYNDGETWQPLGGKVVSEQSTFVLAAGQLAPGVSGRVGWRVRTYNSDNVASPWSDTAQFIALTAPNPPAWISIEASKSRPLCRWTSARQIGWQLRILLGQDVVYDTGERYGTDTQHKIPQYLDNGQYTLEARIMNELNLWSEYASQAIFVNARKTLEIQISGAGAEGGARILIESVVVKP